LLKLIVSSSSVMFTTDELRLRAKALGFDLCGIAPATALPELTRLRESLDAGYAGEMIYLHKSAETRADIRNFLSSARSVIVTGTVYYTDHRRVEGEGVGSVTPSDAVEIARYAWGDDYHIVLAERLDALVAWLRDQSETPFEAKIFVDKHHVQERVFAKYAGLGWIGKNTCIINPELGSWLFLAGAAVSLELPVDVPALDQCGECTLCLDSCPTGALVDPYVMDATKCISYLTIELNDCIPAHQRGSVGNHVFGCDICQDVCPWNLAPLGTSDEAWTARAGRATPRAAELWQRSDQQLHALVDRSAMRRTSLSRLRRNLAVTLGNSGDPRMAEVLDRAGGGVPRAAPSAHTALVTEHVEWAKEKLSQSTAD